MLTKAKIKKILSQRIETLSSLNLPHFSLLNGIDKAVETIYRHKNSKITIVGDYDVDGVVSSAVLKLFLKEISIDAEVVIPDRFRHGYGLSTALLKEIDADLIITVDNGVTSFEAANECEKRGIELIITDHHTPVVENGSYKLPKASALINPKTSPDFPFKEICGAEVAWYLCAALKHRFGADVDLRKFTDMLSLAIIADVMPLTHMNRTLVAMGLKRLNRAKSPFSRALKRFFNREFTSEDVAYQIAPRLNAAGRMKSAQMAFDFLTSQSDDEAFFLLMELDALNNLRKQTQNEAVESIEQPEGDFIVVKGDFHEGVVGIVASSLVYRYKKPAIVLSQKGDVLKGSGRSLGNVDIFRLVSECAHLLEGFGGHKMACGLSLKNEHFETFKKMLNSKIKIYSQNDFFIEDYVLGELPFKEIDLELVEILKEFEPYGEGNPKPKFTAKCEVLEIQNLKENHFKLILSQDDIILPAVIFGYDGEFTQNMEIKFSITQNSYYGRSVELIIEEVL